MDTIIQLSRNNYKAPALNTRTETNIADVSGCASDSPCFTTKGPTPDEREALSDPQNEVVLKAAWSSFLRLSSALRRQQQIRLRDHLLDIPQELRGRRAVDDPVVEHFRTDRLTALT